MSKRKRIVRVVGQRTEDKKPSLYQQYRRLGLSHHDAKLKLMFFEHNLKTI